MHVNEQRVRSLGSRAFATSSPASSWPACLLHGGIPRGGAVGVVNPDMLSSPPGAVLMMVILGGMGTLAGPLSAPRAHAPAGTRISIAAGGGSGSIFASTGATGHRHCAGGVVSAQRYHAPVATGQARWLNPFCRRVACREHFGGLTAVSEVSLACEMGKCMPSSVRTARARSRSSICCRAICPQAPARCCSRAGTSRDSPRIAFRRNWVLRAAVGKANLFLPFTAFENCRRSAGLRTRCISSGRPSVGGISTRPRTRRSAQAVSMVAPTSSCRRCSTASSARSKSPWRWRRAHVLLLEREPLAGMGAEESLRIVLAAGVVVNHAILLVEHDMDVVFAVANSRRWGR